MGRPVRVQELGDPRSVQTSALMQIRAELAALTRRVEALEREAPPITPPEGGKVNAKNETKQLVANLAVALSRQFSAHELGGVIASRLGISARHVRRCLRGK